MPKPSHRRSRELQRLPEARPGELSFIAFAGAIHYLEQINILLEEGLAPPYDSATESDGDRATRNERSQKFHWHLRGFFWELLGAFELMLMWANDHFGLEIPERDVTVDRLLRSRPTSHTTDWPRIRELLEAAWLSEWLFEIRMYRHFAHRSFLNVLSMVRKEDGSAAMFLPRAREGQPYVPQVPMELERYLSEMRKLGAAVFPR